MGSKTSFKITGLCCGEEVATLKKAVASRDGILELDFDILNNRMITSYDPGRITPQGIISAVAETGMKAQPWDGGKAPEPQESLWQRHSRLIMVIISGLFLLSGFLSHWILHGSLVEALTAGNDQKAHSLPLASLVFYSGAVISGAWFVIPKAIFAARRLRPDMNFLMTLAVIGAMLIGEWFEAASVAFLFALALLLEHWSVGRARRAISALMALTPNTARYICPNDGDIMEKPVESVPLGVTALVRPGEKIPLDGIVLKGFSAVNQVPITGESIPVEKEPGDELFAGTINGDGALEFEVTRPADDTVLARIIHLVQDAQARRAPSEQWVEKFARRYTPAMILLALGVALLPPLFLAGGWIDWFYRALVILVIACPCALVISTPVSVVSSLTAAARNGVLIKGGMYLEAAGRIRALALDKTGTLTRGEPEVQHIVPFHDHSEAEILARAAALETHSDHPLARAILHKASQEGFISPLKAENFQVFRGKGAQADMDGRRFWIGSHRFMEEVGEETPEVHEKAETMEDAGHSVVALGHEEHVCGLISIADGLRDESRGLVDDLHNLGIRPIMMLTGDNATTARAVAELAGVDEYRAELLPEDKVEAVAELTREHGQVAMVGDGVNDAPAMAAATFGIAMGAMGTDAAIETADIALMADDLSKIPWLVRHSRRTLKIIQQNIGFALGVKLIFLAFAFLGDVSLWLAIAADMGASLLVVSNGLRLLKK